MLATDSARTNGSGTTYLKVKIPVTQVFIMKSVRIDSIAVDNSFNHSI